MEITKKNFLKKSLIWK